MSSVNSLLPKIACNPDGIPTELRDCPQWVAWKLLPDPGKPKPKKVPFNPKTDTTASAGHPETWGTFAEACSLYSRPGVAGIGFEFHTSDPFCGGDIDNCRNPETGEISPKAWECIRIANTYTEISQSGTGVKFIARASKISDEHSKRGDVEMYHAGRFFALTGNHLAGTPETIEDRQEEFAELYRRWFAEPKPIETDRAVVRNASGSGRRLTDQEILDKIGRADNADKFHRLFGGDKSAYLSNSEAVEALLWMLCYYTNSSYGNGTAQLEALFRKSELCTPDYDRPHGGKPSKAAYECARASQCFTGKVYDPQPQGVRAQMERNGKTTLPEASRPDFDLSLSFLPMTDLGNAERLVSRFRNRIRYCHQWLCWLIWDGTRWVQDEDGEIYRIAQQAARSIFREVASLTKKLAEGVSGEPVDLMSPKSDEPHKARREPEDLLKWQKRSESKNALQAMIDIARNQEGVSVTVNALDANPMRLNLLNGTLDLSTGELMPHDRADLITKRVEIEFRADAECPTWLRFLSEIMNADAETVDFLRRAVGYSLTGDTREQCLFFCYGNGQNGKSTFTNILENLLGEYWIKVRAETFMADRNPQKGATPELAKLKGARLVTVSEIEEGRRLNESLIKDLTGGDVISARELYQAPFEYTPCFKPWMYGNHKPVVRGDDEGIWRRQKLIPFTVRIPDEKKDMGLADKLRDELPGIMRWAVNGCLEWQQGGLLAPASVVSATKEYRAEMDIVGQFIDECCVIGRQYSVNATKLYKEYLVWCEGSGDRPMSQRTFGERLKSKDFEKEKRNNGIFRLGIGIKTEGNDPDSGNSEPFNIHDEIENEPCEPCEAVLTKNPLVNDSRIGGLVKIGSQGSQGSQGSLNTENAFLPSVTLQEEADSEEFGELII